MAIKDKVVSGPGHTGPVQQPPIEEAIANAEQAAQEADPLNRVRPGQDVANQYFRDVAEQGIEEAKKQGIPEGIFKGMAIDPRVPITDGMIRELFPVGFSLASVTPQTMKEFGINPEWEVPQWVLQDEYAGGAKFEQQHMENNPYDRKVFNGKGEACTRQGMVLFARPKNVQDYIDKRFNAISEAMGENAQLVDQGMLDGLPASEKDVNDTEGLARIKKRTSEAISALMATSPSQGFGHDNLDTARRVFTEEQMAQHIEDARWPGGVSASHADIENQKDRAVETVKDATAGRKSFAVSGFRDKQPA